MSQMNQINGPAWHQVPEASDRSTEGHGKNSEFFLCPMPFTENGYLFVAAYFVDCFQADGERDQASTRRR